MAVPLILGLIAFGAFIFGTIEAGKVWITTLGIILAGTIFSIIFLNVATDMLNIAWNNFVLENKSGIYQQHEGGKKSVYDLLGKDSLVLQSFWWIFCDFSYMLLAIGFVIVGIATALQIQDYTAKRLLPILIIVAILIRFSWAILWPVADASTEAMKIFGQDIKFIKNPGFHAFNILRNFLHFGPGYTKELAKAGAMIIINSLWGVAYLTAAMIIFLRQIALGILIVLSPLAIIAMPFKISASLWQRWLQQFFLWTLVGIFVSMGVNLASHLMATEQGVNTSAYGTYGEVFRFLPALFALLACMLLGGTGNLAVANTLTSAFMSGTYQAVGFVSTMGIAAAKGAAKGAVIGATAGAGGAAGAAGAAGGGGVTAGGGGAAAGTSRFVAGTSNIIQKGLGLQGKEFGELKQYIKSFKEARGAEKVVHAARIVEKVGGAPRTPSTKDFEEAVGKGISFAKQQIKSPFGKT